jgi:tryptophan synthase alpha chain
VKRIRKFTRLPIAVGFGISNPQQFAEVGQFADAGVVGSAIVQMIEQNPGNEAGAVEGFVRSLKAGATSVGASQS